MFTVIESTPGYLSEDDDPPTFEEYADAVAYMIQRASEYENDPDGNYRVDFGYASRDNYAAANVWDRDKSHDLGRMIEVVLIQD